MIFHIPAYENVYRPENKQAVGRTRKLFPIIANSRIKIPAIFRAISGKFSRHFESVGVYSIYRGTLA